jgi:mono/diheme cytochrome c family protein
VVRRTVGYRRYEGLEAAAALARLYTALRLFVNFFQPSFKLAGKARDGAKVTEKYHPPATPYQRLMADIRTSEEVRRQVTAIHATLDPVRLLQTIRAGQQELVEIADRPTAGEAVAPWSTFRDVTFASGAAMAWFTDWCGVCHGAHFGEGPVPWSALRGPRLAMLARKSALRVAPGGSAPPNPLRCAPRLRRRQVGTGKQARRSNRKAGFPRPATRLTM